MKAKIRPHNLPQSRQNELDRVAREFVDDRIDEYMKKIFYKLNRRLSFALALNLNDKLDFDEKQCQNAIEGINEILHGVAEDVYDKNELDPEGRDKMVDAMDAELIDRGIHITIIGDPVYGTKREKPASAATDTSQVK